MKRTRLIIICVLTGLIAIAAGMYALRPREPSYQGKSLSIWLEEATTGTHTWPQSTNSADEAIRHIGTNAFPMVTRLLHSRDSVAKLKLIQVSYKLPLLHLHVPTQAERHKRAIAACFALGPSAKPLVPEVAKALDHMDYYSRPFARIWLMSLGPDADEAVPALVALLKDTNSPTRWVVPVALGRISLHRRREVVPVLNECLKDTNKMVASCAQDALNVLNAGDRPGPAKADK